MNVSAWSIRNPIAAVMLFVLLVLAGLMSFHAMKVQNFPDLDLPTVNISATLPGAAPAQLETEVARKDKEAWRMRLQLVQIAIGIAQELLAKTQCNK